MARIYMGCLYNFGLLINNKRDSLPGVFHTSECNRHTHWGRLHSFNKNEEDRHKATYGFYGCIILGRETV